MIVEQPPHRLLPETSARQRVGGEQRIAHLGVKLLAEPVRDRHREAPLARRRAFGRQALARGLAEQPLADAASKLEVLRQSSGPLDQPVVEERDAQLLRGRHRHLVRLHQQIVRQPDAAIELEHALQRGQPFGLRPLLREPLHQPFADAPRRQPREARLLVVGEGHRHSAVALLERQRRPAQVLPRLRMTHERQRNGGQRRRRAQLLHPQHRAVDGVPGQQLVGAFAREHDHHFLPGALRQVVERHAGGVRDRLVHVPDQVGEETLEVLGGDQHLAMLGPQRAGHAARLVQLGAAVVGQVPHRERLHPALSPRLAQIDHLRGDAARIEAAGEEHAHRHVCHQPRLGRVLEALPQLERQLGLVPAVGLVGELTLPEAADPQRTLLVHGARAGRQLLDAGEHRQRRGHVAGAEVQIERLVVQLARDGGVAEQRLDLGSEEEPIAAEVVVDRLLAEPVAREEQALPARVPDGEGEHPAQALGERVAPLLVTVDQDFGVAAGAEDVAPGDQLLAQPEVVVDLAVEGDGDGAVLVLHRLRAGLREVDDRQPPVPQRRRTFDEVAGPVRTPVRNGVGHLTQQRLVSWTFPVAIHEAADAAHAVTP